MHHHTNPSFSKFHLLIYLHTEIWKVMDATKVFLLLVSTVLEATMRLTNQTLEDDTPNVTFKC